MDEFQARRLVTAYADMILRISYQYLKQTQDAEDICQTVFLKYLSNNCEFDSVEHEKAWIIRATINTCKDHLKSAFFRRTVPLEEAVQVAAPAVPDRPILDAMKQYPNITASAFTCTITKTILPGRSERFWEKAKQPSISISPGAERN